MARKTLNPITGLKSWITGIVQEAQVPAAIPLSDTNGDSLPKDGDPVEGTFIDATGNNGSAASTLPHLHTEKYRQVIDSFDENKETLLETGVRWFFMMNAYVWPILIAFFVGRAIGDAYAGGPINWQDGWNSFNHVLSWGMEIMLASLTFAASVALRRMFSDLSSVGMFVVIVVALVFFSLASGLAQWFMAEAHVRLTNSSGIAALVFRVSAAPCVDIGSLFVLGVIRVRSLKKFLADQHHKATAIREVNQSEIEVQAATVKAAMDMQAAMMDMEQKAERARVWNELEKMQGQSMIDQARRNMLPAPGESGGYRRSRY